jgi:hypothetical protein
MPVLNEQLQFEKFENYIRSGFNGGRANKKLLKQGALLYRFSGHTNLSAWWSEINDLPLLLMGAKKKRKVLQLLCVKKVQCCDSGTRICII